ncbi:MAG: hypothetical protein J0L72_03510 [Armatimonadetes bacterium]|nr:hypothetical protein [Armatimonadota bacterium]
MISVLNSSFAQAGQLDGTGLLMRLILFYAVGGIFFVLGYLSQLKKGKRWSKFVFGGLPMLAAVFFSWEYFTFSLDDFHRATGIMAGNREVIYKISPFVSMVMLALVIVVGIFLDRRESQRRELD